MKVYKIMNVRNFYQEGKHLPEMHRDILGEEFVFQLDFWKSIELIKLAERLELKKNCSVLDIGTGWGGPLSLFAERYGIVGDGIDLSEYNINIARKHANDCNVSDKINFYLCDVNNFETKRKYDFIIMLDSLVHIENKKRLMKKCYRMLSEAGKILIAVECANKNISKEEMQKRNDLGAVYTESIEDYRSTFLEQGFEIEYSEEYSGKRSEFAEKALLWMEIKSNMSNESMKQIHDLDVEKKVSEWVFILKKKN